MPELLTLASIPLSSIDLIIWSHHHVDHTGDVSLFPPTTSLVVGPGFKTNPSTYPGFPLNPDAHLPHAAFAGRDVIELDFSSTAGEIKLAGLRAIDWFDDGSLYLLEAPGHAPEYIMALARTSADNSYYSQVTLQATRASYVRARFTRSQSPSRSTARLVRSHSSSSRRTSYLILLRAARRLMRCRRLTRTNMCSSFLITVHPYAILVSLSHSRLGRSRVASMVVLGSMIIARTPYTGAFWKIFGRASTFSVTNGRTSSVRSVGFATL